MLHKMWRCLQHPNCVSFGVSFLKFNFLCSLLFPMDVFKDMSILSWNIRVANNPRAKRHIRELNRKFHPSIFIVMETHISFARVSRFWDRLGFSPVAIIKAQGHAGGLWVLKQSRQNWVITVEDTMVTTLFPLGLVWVLLPGCALAYMPVLRSLTYFLFGIILVI